MTYQEFLAILRHARGPWWFQHVGDFPGRETSATIVAGRNRPYGPIDTPLTLICKKNAGTEVATWESEKAGVKLGLPLLVAKQISEAEHDLNPYDPRVEAVRKDLLAACRLQESTTRKHAPPKMQKAAR